jgi:hypothetical protein
VAVTGIGSEVRTAFVGYSDEVVTGHPVLRLIHGGPEVVEPISPPETPPGQTSEEQAGKQRAAVYDLGHLAALSKLVSGNVVAFSADNVEILELDHRGVYNISAFIGMQILYALADKFKPGVQPPMDKEWLIGGAYQADLDEIALRGIGKQALDKSNSRAEFHRQAYRINEHPEIFLG